MFTSIAATSCSLYQTYLTRTINKAVKRGEGGGGGPGKGGGGQVALGPQLERGPQKCLSFEFLM